MDEFWNDRWKDKNTKWHLTDVHEFLIKYFNIYCPISDGKVRVFVPLCGKTVDMKWLIDEGCDVVGVELSKIACDEFFEEQQIAYDLLSIDGLPAYKAKEHSLVIYNCNLFEFADKTSILKFHFIWDRGSLVVMSDEERPRYAGFIKKWMAEDFAYLIEAPLYNSNEYQGFPRALEFNALVELYGDVCKCIEVEKREFLEKAKKLISPNLTSFFWCIYLVLPK